MTALLETLFPTAGDVLAGAVWLLIGAGLLWAAVTGARELELLDADDELDPEPPPRHLPSAVRIIPAAPFDWQHETDL